MAVTGGLSDWDAARLFAEVVHCRGSLNAAADARLTKDGALMVSAVVRIKTASFDVLPASETDMSRVPCGRTHVLVFARLKQLETHGASQSLEEMARHRLVQVADEAATQEAFDSAFAGRAQHDQVVIKTPISSTNQTVNSQRRQHRHSATLRSRARRENNTTRYPTALVVQRDERSHPARAAHDRLNTRSLPIPRNTVETNSFIHGTRSGIYG